MPGLEVGGLGRADAKQDSQDYWIGNPQGQGRVDAGAALLNEAEMERRRVGDGPDVLVRLCIGVGFGDCQKLPLGQVRNRRLKNGRVNIGVLGAAAIAGPPAGVDGKLQEICEPLTDFCRVDPRRRTAFQSAEFIGACAYQSQEPVDEGNVARDPSRGFQAQPKISVYRYRFGDSCQLLPPQ